MKISVVGGRDVPSSFYPTIKNILDRYVSKGDSLISGGAIGVDKMVEKYARERELPITVHQPDYQKYGKKAPLIRNRKIAEECDVLIAFPSKNSKGTWHTVNLAKKLGKRVEIINLEEIK